jgi:hypothetical protein
LKPRLWWLAPLLVLASAHGQKSHGVRLMIYGADSVSQCAAPVKALQTELQTLPYPDGWTIGVVCNAVAWEEIVRIANPPQTSTAFSNLIRRSTVLNAAIFREPRSKYRHTLAHELGHANCNCKDEDKAEEFALRHDGLHRTLARAHAGDEGH